MMQRNRLVLPVTLALTLCSAMLLIASGVNAAGIYDGTAPGDDTVTVHPWGGGTGTDLTGSAYTAGNHAIKVDSLGPYQGVQLALAHPAALGDLTDKTRYILFVVSVAASPRKDTYTQPGNRQYGFGGPSGHFRFTALPEGSYQVAQGPMLGIPPGMSGPPMGGPPPGMYGGPPGGFIPPQGGGTYGQGGYGSAVAEQGPPPLAATSLHLVFTFSSGAKVDVQRNLQYAPTDSTWIKVGVPISALPIPSADAAAPAITQINIASDTPALVTIGQIAIVHSTEAITASAGQEKNTDNAGPTVFDAIAHAGPSSLIFEWDFDTKDGFVAQAEGQHATHRYTAAGTYTATLRVRDADGLKQPVTSTVIVHVTESGIRR